MKPICTLEIPASASDKGVRQRPWVKVAGFLRIPGKSRFGPSPASPILALEGVVGDLKGLNRHTEERFLAVSGKLTELLDEVKHISAETEALTDLGSGIESEHTANSLRGALARSERMQAKAANTNAALVGIHQTSAQLSRTFSGLEGTESRFQAIATLTRVETARLGSAGSDFGHLAEEVRQLAGNIQSGVDSTIESASRLTGSVEVALQCATDAGGRNAKDLPSVVGGIGKTLDSIQQGQQRTQEVSLRLHRQFAEVSGSIQDVALSLQVQDITRQRVEHVIEALEQLGAEGERGDWTDGLPPNAGAVLALQSAQLADAEGRFLLSVAQVRRDLELVATRVGEITADSQTLAELFESQEKTCFVDVERGCTTILSAIQGCCEADDRIEDTAARLSDATGQVRAIVETLQGINLRMQRLALNAIIRAVHIGDAGNALGVLAIAMKDLAFDAGQRAEAAFGLLESMQAGSALLSEEGGGGLPGQKTLVEELRGAIDAVHASSERSYARIQMVQHLGSQLRGELSAARESFDPGQAFTEVVQRTTVKLAGVADHAASTRATRDDPAGGMQGLGRRYTMQSEREVHRAADGAASHAEIAVSAGEAEGDPGGSVELF